MKSLRQVYKETKVRVTTYIVCSTNCWIRIAWKREYSNKYKILKRETEQALHEVGVEVNLGRKKFGKMARRWRKNGQDAGGR